MFYGAADEPFYSYHVLRLHKRVEEALHILESYQQLQYVHVRNEKERQDKEDDLVFLKSQLQQAHNDIILILGKEILLMKGNDHER